MTLVYGIDIAETMLRLAEERKRQEAIENVIFLREIPEREFSWINSAIVFQHIPPARGYKLLRQLAGQLFVGGILSLQITFFRDPRHFGEMERDIAACRYDGENISVLKLKEHDTSAQMSMYDYDLNRIFLLLTELNIDQIYLEHTDHGGCHGARIFGIRAR